MKIMMVVAMCFLLFSFETAYAEQSGPTGAYVIVRKELHQGDPASIDRAIASIDEFIKLDHQEDFLRVDGDAEQTLTRLGRWKELDRILGYDLWCRASDIGLVELIQQQRVDVSLKMKMPEIALERAKSLYNVCRMARTADSIQLMAHCLATCDGNFVRANQLLREQVAGAALIGGATRPGTDLGTTIWASIKIDNSEYLDRIHQLDDNINLFHFYSGPDQDATRLAAKGNLLLLAGCGGDARVVFEKYFSICDDNKVTEAAEGIARSIRAQDGSVGRANAWVLSIRPKDE